MIKRTTNPIAIIFNFMIETFYVAKTMKDATQKIPGFEIIFFISKGVISIAQFSLTHLIIDIIL